MRPTNEVAGVVASRRQLLGDVTEAEWQREIMFRLAQHGWTAFHIETSILRMADGRLPIWATAVTPEGKGFPDILAVRGNRLLLIEVKAMRGRISVDQSRWGRLLKPITEVGYDVLRPSDQARLLKLIA